jgi:hypothetical protein
MIGQMHELPGMGRSRCSIRSFGSKVSHATWMSNFKRSKTKDFMVERSTERTMRNHAGNPEVMVQSRHQVIIAFQAAGIHH